MPEIFLWTRAAIWAAALFALFVFVPNRHPRAARWDDPTLTHDLGARMFLRKPVDDQALLDAINWVTKDTSEA